MTVAFRSLKRALVISSILSILLACKGNEGADNTGRLVIDSEGREVSIPDTVRSVIPLKSVVSALTVLP